MSCRLFYNEICSGTSCEWAAWLLYCIPIFDTILPGLFMGCHLFMCCHCMCIRYVQLTAEASKNLFLLLQRCWPCQLIGHYVYGTRLLAEKYSAILNGTAYLLNFLIVINAYLQLMNLRNLLLAAVKNLSTVQLKEVPRVFFMQFTSLCWIHKLVVVLFIMWALQRKSRKSVSVHVHKAPVAQWQTEDVSLVTVHFR